MQQPLTIILVQAQLLQRQVSRGEAVEPERLGTRLAYILAAATRMRGITQDLLDVSVQHSGRPLALLLAKTEFVALTRQVVREHQLVTDRHQFLFETESPSAVVSVDETRAHRVIANLLTNAIKYSPKGGPVRVTINETDAPDGKTVVLVVRDEGLGIPKDDLPYVSDRFRRGANVIGRFAGTGLGPASARELVELYGGTISVLSEEAEAAPSSSACRWPETGARRWPRWMHY